MSLSVQDGDVVLNVDQITGPRSIVSERWVGRRTPYYCTSNGKVLVAFLSEAERERRLSSPLTPETPHTIGGAGHPPRGDRCGELDRTGVSDAAG